MGNKTVATYWYQNIKKTSEHLDLTESYSPEKYPRFENFDAINVDSIKDIPKDYYDNIGVPVRFIRYCDDGWELLGSTRRYGEYSTKRYTINDAENYYDLNASGVLRDGDKYIIKYTRLIVRRKK